MKKVLSLLLVGVMAAGMTSVAFAATNKVESVTANIFKKGMYNNDGATGAKIVYSNGYDVGGINPGAEFWVPILDTDVTWSGVQKSTSASTLSTGKLTVKTKTITGGEVIDEIKITNAGLKVAFVDPFKSNDPDGKDFEVEITAAVNGKKDEDTTITVIGTLSNDDTTIDPDDDDDEIYLDNGQILKPEGFIRGIDINIDDTVVINANLYKNKKIWASINEEPNDDDLVYYDAYKGIVESMRVDTIGLSGANYITFTDKEFGLYVYTADVAAVDADDTLKAEAATLTYIGKTAANAKFPLYKNYYFANKQLDIDELDNEPEDDDDNGYDDVPEAPPVTGGDDGYPAGNFDNPSTGR